MSLEIIDSFASNKYPLGLRSKSMGFDDLAQGVFSLNPEYLNPKTPKVLESLVALEGSRLIHGRDNVFITVDGSWLRKISYDALNHVIEGCFDESATLEALSHWSIKALFIEQDQLIAEAVYQKQEPVLIKVPLMKFEHIYQKQFQAFHKHRAIELLKHAKLLGPDLLYVSMDKGHDSEKSTRVLFPQGGVLNLSSEKIFYSPLGWCLKSEEVHYVAQFIQEGVDGYFLVSDKQGIFEMKIPLIKEKESNFAYAKLVPQNVQVYPQKYMTCRIGSQKFVLREHDWVCIKGRLAHVLKSKNEIMSLLEFKQSAPLCIIEEITLSKNKSLVRGKIFSPLRMSMHPFEIEAPVVQSKVQHAKKNIRGVSKSSL